MPVLKLQGHAFGAYLYVLGLLHAYDQYGDGMNIVGAYKCAFALRHWMAGVFAASLALQVLAGMAAQFGAGGLWTAAGLLPEGAVAGRFYDSLRYAAVTGMARFFTENLPQAYLAVRLTGETGATGLV